MVLTAIPTAINGRLRVFAGVHCRTDSLQVRISGHRPTAADASPVTYKQGVSSSSLLAPTIITPSESHEIDRSVILIGLEGGQVPRVRLHCVQSRPFYDDQMATCLAGHHLVALKGN
jgi:hypothetical protein